MLDLFDVGAAAGKLHRPGGAALAGAVQVLMQEKSTMTWRFLGRVQVCCFSECPAT